MYKIIAVCMTACLVGQAQANEDNLFFSGTLVNEPCVLATESEAVTLDFGNIVDKALYLNGRTRGEPVVLRLQNCTPEVGAKGVSITLHGAESIDPPGLLVVAEGLLVGLERGNGQALALNKAHPMGDLVNGENLIGFNAYLQRDLLAGQILQPGRFEGTVTFSLSYE
ncbi:MULTISPECIES: fimbrial protein [unclassified Pseudomonas]|uniref:fimbrial protein n=1 Tax=unclassified Pseudomonas TaxID=196821 RepID=UPI000C883D4E|nr:MULTISPECIES: fimbrial protein [unclassified Pseudomonas]PNA02133.1 exotoxin [Pseudomonas sp. FW305-42]PNA23051.1 exotoxin [Pseudomonas sp. MPR-R1B]PNB28390.1 exotoxin [Pseudomonas sp. DP16D-E2]PNB44743.1 exotoxin [Pseudomonas sp. FW305-17]PNB64190.1 exotoxin [Pseudomonas sp. GW531-E2]